jgi:hypothetical protein
MAFWYQIHSTRTTQDRDRAVCVYDELYTRGRAHRGGLVSGLDRQLLKLFVARQ